MYIGMLISLLLFSRAIHCSGLEDLLLYIASSEDERNFSMHVLEIVSLMFREQVHVTLLSFLCTQLKAFRTLVIKNLDSADHSLQSESRELWILLVVSCFTWNSEVSQLDSLRYLSLNNQAPDNHTMKVFWTKCPKTYLQMFHKYNSLLFL